MKVLLVFSAIYLITAVQSARIAVPVCDEPPNIDHASIENVSDDSYLEGTIITYSCDLGYVVSGEGRILKCIKSGGKAQWTNSQFSCIPQSCGDPGRITNGRRIGSLFTFPNSVRYFCEEGYVIRGLATRYCQTSGTWSGTLPECMVVNCGAPEVPENGLVSASSFEYGSELRYKCNKGFHLSSDETVHCTEKGTWSRSDISCIETTCNIPEKPAFGDLQFLGNDERPRAGTVAIFSCQDNRIPYGPTTSKCLDIGEWNYPPPKCLNPCTIPRISNGVIVQYVKDYYGNVYFQEIPIETPVENKEYMYLRCSEGYEVADSEYHEMQISCSRGKWSVEPICEPRSCRSRLPYAPNSEVLNSNRKHGGTASYRCLPDFRKVINETVICDRGVWKGDPPTCKSTKCSVDSLQSGVLKGTKPYYKDGEIFRVTCDLGYRLAEGFDGQVRCENGVWIISYPPCVPANCSSLPPSIEHGSVRESSQVHGAVAKYLCEYPYVLIEKSLVQCVKGKWQGAPPRCQDSRCFLKDLKNLIHVSVETPSVTLSGNKPSVICENGYSAKRELPICRDGVWEKYFESLCMESYCLVPSINHGSVTEKISGGWFSRDTYKSIRIGSLISSGITFWLKCDKYYSIHGSRIQLGEVKCYKGRWSVDLVCLRDGDRYIPTAAPVVLPSKSDLETSTIRSFPTTQSTRSTESVPTTEVIEDKLFTVTETPIEECFCEYPINDNNIVAHEDDKQLQFKDKIRNGSTITFRCQLVGYHRFRGRQEITCVNCQPWKSSDLPSCIAPKDGEAVIGFDRNVNILKDGTIEIQKGISTNFTCIAMGSSKNPEWNTSADISNLDISRDRVKREDYGDVVYLTYLRINNVNEKNEGTYECFLEGSPKTRVHVIVTAPDLQCPSFPEVDGIIITYEMERRVKSKAYFSCPRKGQELVGKPTATCLRSANWSDKLPYCSGIRCSKIKETNLLQIDYEHNREIDSTARFHCVVPGKRRGVSFTTCLEDATWADPTPICEVPTCTLSDLRSAVPPYILPQTDDVKNDLVPYNSSVKLLCSNEEIAVGSPVAKCELGGRWKIDTIRCEPGCPPPDIQAGSKLIWDPVKEIYKLGDRLTFSCPPGMHLDSELQVNMCLTNRWSEIVLPKCEVSADYEDFPDYTPISSQPTLEFQD